MEHKLQQSELDFEWLSEVNVDGLAEDDSEVYMVEDIQRKLRISRGKAYRLIKEPDFPKIKVGTTYRIPKKEFMEWLGIASKAQLSI